MSFSIISSRKLSDFSSLIFLPDKDANVRSMAPCLDRELNMRRELAKNTNLPTCRSGGFRDER
jgi:hypothetical protein